MQILNTLKQRLPKSTRVKLNRDLHFNHLQGCQMGNTKWTSNENLGVQNETPAVTTLRITQATGMW